MLAVADALGDACAFCLSRDVPNGPLEIIGEG